MGDPTFGDRVLRVSAPASPLRPRVVDTIEAARARASAFPNNTTLPTPAGCHRPHRGMLYVAQQP